MPKAITRAAAALFLFLGVILALYGLMKISRAYDVAPGAQAAAVRGEDGRWHLSPEASAALERQYRTRRTGFACLGSGVALFGAGVLGGLWSLKRQP
jgi:hypothetical protein